MGVAPGSCIKVGDSLNDVGAARAAGMMSCYISGGENLPAQMRENPPDCSIVTLPDLL
jgi:beta-phosphoglucomutase-like phosphatase (HAD superfamily)